MFVDTWPFHQHAHHIPDLFPIFPVQIATGLLGRLSAKFLSLAKPEWNPLDLNLHFLGGFKGGPLLVQWTKLCPNWVPMQFLFIKPTPKKNWAKSFFSNAGKILHKESQLKIDAQSTSICYLGRTAFITTLLWTGTRVVEWASPWLTEQLDAFEWRLKAGIVGID